jgi:hypothetical protein
MHLGSALVLVFIAGGAAFVPFFLMRTRMEVAVAKARAGLAELRADARADDHLMAERLKNTEAEVKQQALDELMRELRFEESPYTADSNASGAAADIQVPVKRLFFRSLRLFSWIDREPIASDVEAAEPLGSFIRSPSPRVMFAGAPEVGEAAIPELLEPAVSSSVRKLFLTAAAGNSPVDSPNPKEGTQMFGLGSHSKPISPNGSHEDRRVIADLPIAPVPESNGTNSNGMPAQTVSSSAEEVIYKSTFRLTTTSTLNQNPTDSFKEGTQMLKQMSEAPAAQNSSRPSEDLRLARQLTSTINSWNGKEPTQEQIPAALASVDEIYHKSNFKPTTTTAEWHILKVADMLSSEHLRGLSAAAKHSALLMALEAAGVSVEDVLQDAVLRQRVLNEYEQNQQSRLQQLESVKLRESERLTAEMEAIRSQYEARIAVVVDGLERERGAVREWQANKEVEQRRIAEAAACISYASNENNVKYLVEKNGNGQRSRESVSA